MCFVLLVLLVIFVDPVVCRKRKAKTDTTAHEDEIEAEEVNFSSKTDLDAKIKNLKKDKRASLVDDELTPKARKQLETAELSLKKQIARAVLDYGDVSHEKAKALHALGGNLFKQGRMTDLVDLSKEIVHIHEELDGPESELTGKALGNVGAVACRVNLRTECNRAMSRALYILLQSYGEDSKEVMLHRGKMLTFQVPDAENTGGLSYTDFLALQEDEL